MKFCYALALVAALTACAKGSNGGNAQASAAAAARNPASASDGAVVFVTNCASCHQSNGQGVPGAFPPLAGNPVVTGDPSAVIRIVNNGLQGKIVVNGTAYNGMMPSWRGQISDDKIAAVVTYIRSAWGNRAGGVTPQQVR